MFLVMFKQNFKFAKVNLKVVWGQRTTGGLGGHFLFQFIIERASVCVCVALLKWFNSLRRKCCKTLLGRYSWFRQNQEIENMVFNKKGQSRPLFVYFHPFLVTISITQIEISLEGVLGIWTIGHRMVGADETMDKIFLLYLKWSILVSSGGKDDFIDFVPKKVL